MLFFVVILWWFAFFRCLTNFCIISKQKFCLHEFCNLNLLEFKKKILFCQEHLSNSLSQTCSVLRCCLPHMISRYSFVYSKFVAFLLLDKQMDPFAWLMTIIVGDKWLNASYLVILTCLQKLQPLNREWLELLLKSTCGWGAVGTKLQRHKLWVSERLVAGWCTLLWSAGKQT